MEEGNKYTHKEIEFNLWLCKLRTNRVCLIPGLSQLVPLSQRTGTVASRAKKPRTFCQIFEVYEKFPIFNVMRTKRNNRKQQNPQMYGIANIIN